MTSLMADAIRALMEGESDREALKEEFFERIRNSPSRGTGGKITWTREELHER
jgi:hypothetical protein